MTITTASQLARSFTSPILEAYKSSMSSEQTLKWLFHGFELPGARSRDHTPTARPDEGLENAEWGIRSATYVYRGAKDQHVLDTNQYQFNSTVPYPHTKKKNAIAAAEVLVSPKLRRMVIIIMQKLRQPAPTIIVFLRPMRSSANAGKVFPTMNISSTNPAISCAFFFGTLTFVISTDGISYSPSSAGQYHQASWYGDLQYTTRLIPPI